jgi:hypothetical protein
MARTNKISGVFTDADKVAVITKINETKALMPFLITLTEADRKKLRGIGNKNLSYVQKCLEGAIAFPDELKKNFDTAEFKKDVELFNNIIGAYVACAALLEMIDDSMKAAGIDAMGSSSEVYDSLKSSAKNNANVKAIVAEIAERFKGQSNKGITKTPKA